MAAAYTAAGNGLLFLIILWVLAVSRGLGAAHRSERPPLNEVKPAAVTMVITPAAPQTAEPREKSKKFILAPDGMAEAKPEEAPDFHSSQDMRAAAEEAASPDGIEGLASSRGADIPSIDLTNSRFRDGENGPPAPDSTAAEAVTASPLQPQAAPELPPDNSPPEPPRPDRLVAETAKPQKTPEPARASERPPEAVRETEPMPGALTFRDHGAQTLVPMEDFTKPPEPPVPPQATPPQAVARATGPGASERRKAMKLGAVTNKGDDAVDALATEEGKYGKVMSGVIEKSWRRRMLGVSGLANPGLVEVEFEVDARGRIFNVRLANPGEANPVMQDCALSAVIDARLPPPPAALIRSLEDNITGGRFPCTYSFLIY